MDLSKLSYTKDVSERMPKDVVGKKSVRNVSTPAVKMPPVSLAYQKTDGVFSPRLVFVLSGGEKKEKDFLKELVRLENIRSLRVIFMSKEKQGLQPSQMYERWSEIRKTGKFSISGQGYHLDEMDKVFLLTDVDEYYKELVAIQKAVATDDKDQGRWIVSNPCFEMWLYYCFLNNPTHDLSSLVPLSDSKRSKTLKKLGDKIYLGGLNPCRAFEKMHEGIKHSKHYFDVDENGIPVLFATQMHEFAEYMVNVMNEYADEYTEFVERKAEWRTRMMRGLSPSSPQDK